MAKEAEPKPARQSVVAGFSHLVIYACLFLFIGVPTLILFFGWKDIVLLAYGKTVQANVISAQQGKPIFRRDGDWTITYAFHSTGQKFSGSDTLPPALKADTASIEIKYCPKFPAISRIASQVSGTPISALVILVIALRAAIPEFFWRKSYLKTKTKPLNIP